MKDLYNARGVSSQKEDVHEAIKNSDKGLYPNAFCKILPDTIGHSNEHCSIMHADTAGTKSIIAYLYWKETGDLSVWKGIAQDALVMNIDDMICAGATDNMMVSSTIARNKHLIPKEVLAAIIHGCESLVKEWKTYDINITLAGGETADVGDLVKTIDVGYTAYTRLKRSEIIQIAPQAHQVIVGFASYGKSIYENEYNSGIGCNGLTSARHDILNKSYWEKYPESYDLNLPENICYIGKHALTDKTKDGDEIGKMLLSPTRTFAPVVKEILNTYRSKISGIVHNTGGGQTKCLKYIQEPLRIIKDNLLPIPHIFQLIQEASGVAYREMYQVFNMGTRLEVYTDETTAQHIIAVAKKYAIDAQIIGHFEKVTTKSLEIHAGDELIVY